jgi:hypothetical protein
VFFGEPKRCLRADRPPYRHRAGALQEIADLKRKPGLTEAAVSLTSRDLALNERTTRQLTTGLDDPEDGQFVANY